MKSAIAQTTLVAVLVAAFALDMAPMAKGQESSNLKAQSKFGYTTVGTLVSVPSAPPREEQITVLVYNRSQTEDRTLIEGERLAQRLFHQAGVSTIWLSCSLPGPAKSQCRHPRVSQTTLVLTVVRHWSGQANNPHRLGLALEDLRGSGGYCYIFQDSLDELVEETHLNPPRLLGYAMAHEIGHLLKGPHSHAPSGIMSAYWNTNEVEAIRLGALQFTRKDVTTFRATLSAAPRLPRSSF